MTSLVLESGPAQTTVQSSTPLRKLLEPYRTPNNALAFGLLVADIALFALGQALVVNAGSILWTLLGGLFTWIAIVRLFILGHDACHGSLTSSENLNKTLGRIAFLPSLTAFSLWRVGHNVVHHGFNNLKGRDFVWAPLGVDEYAALTPGQQRLHRVYRSAWGPGLYYLVEMWWNRMYFPNERHRPADRSEFTVDSWLVTVFAALWAAWLVLLSARTGQNAALALVIGMVIPYLLWVWTIGLVVYVHHTNPSIPWFSDKSQWRTHNAQVSATEHVTTSTFARYLLHQIMEHQAHHLDAGIPLYRLSAAQKVVSEYYPNLPVQRWSLRSYLACVRQCKLYDFSAQRWLPFPVTNRTNP